MKISSNRYHTITTTRPKVSTHTQATAITLFTGLPFRPQSLSGRNCLPTWPERALLYPQGENVFQSSRVTLFARSILYYTFHCLRTTLPQTPWPSQPKVPSGKIAKATTQDNSNVKAWPFYEWVLCIGAALRLYMPYLILQNVGFYTSQCSSVGTSFPGVPSLHSSRLSLATRKMWVRFAEVEVKRPPCTLVITG